MIGFAILSIVYIIGILEGIVLSSIVIIYKEYDLDFRGRNEDDCRQKNPTEYSLKQDISNIN